LKKQHGGLRLKPGAIIIREMAINKMNRVKDRLISIIVKHAG